MSSPNGSVRRQILAAPGLRGALGWLFVQQLVAASGVLWLAAAVEAVEGGRSPLVPLGAYIASLLLPSLPWMLACLSMQRWEVSTYRVTTSAVVTALDGDVERWPDAEDRAVAEVLLGGEAVSIAQAAVRYLFDFCSVCINVVLNALAIAVVVDLWFAFAFVVACVIAALGSRLSGPRITDAAHEEQETKSRWIKRLLAAWDNVTIGNRYSLGLWRQEESATYGTYHRASMRRESIQQRASFRTFLGSALPVVACVVLVTLGHLDEPTMLLVLLSTLPRQMQILSYLQVAVSYAAEFSGVRTRLAVLERAVADRPKLETDSRIAWDRLELSTEGDPPLPVDSGPALVELVRSRYSGRLTLRGENGAGKSTALRRLKRELGDAAFYLPPAQGLRLSWRHVEAGSTGQSARSMVEEALDHAGAGVLLLDEWDANLDASAREALDRVITEAARTRLVVEARHTGPARHAPGTIDGATQR